MGGDGSRKGSFKINATIQNCRTRKKTNKQKNITCDCSLAMTSCLVTDCFLLLNTESDISAKEVQTCSRATTGTNGSFSGGPTCWVRATGRDLIEQIKTGGRLEARQTPERQHPRRGRSLSVSVLQRKSNRFRFASQRWQPATGISPSQTVSEAVQSPLSGKKQGFLPTSPALALFSPSTPELFPGFLEAGLPAASAVKSKMFDGP